MRGKYGTDLVEQARAQESAAEREEHSAFVAAVVAFYAQYDTV